MDIPLLSIEDVEKEGKVIGVSIRDWIIELLESKGYKHVHSGYSGDGFEGETKYFFIKDDQFVQVIINNKIPEEILGRMAQK